MDQSVYSNSTESLRSCLKKFNVERSGEEEEQPRRWKEREAREAREEAEPFGIVR